MNANSYTIHGTYADLLEKVKTSNDYLGGCSLSAPNKEDVATVFLNAWIRFSMGYPTEMAHRSCADYSQERVELVDLTSGLYVNVGDFITQVSNHVSEFAELIYHIFSQDKQGLISSGIQCIMSVAAAALPNVGRLERKDVCVYLMLLDAVGDSGVAQVSDILRYADAHPLITKKEKYNLSPKEITDTLSKLLRLRVVEQTAPDGYRCTF